MDKWTQNFYDLEYLQFLVMLVYRDKIHHLHNGGKAIEEEEKY